MSDKEIAVKSENTIRELIGSDEFKKKISDALPKHLTPERFARVALMAINKTPALLNCTKPSLFQCLVDLGAMGLEPDGRRAHLIPYGNVATLVVDYKGILDLIMRSGHVLSIHADVVCGGDVFEYDLGEIKQHKIDFRKDRGAVIAVYCMIRMKDGSNKCEVMTKADVESIRSRSKAGKSGPWVTDWNEMAKKTVFRRASKWVPLSPEVRDQIEREDSHQFAGKASSIPVVATPIFEESK